MIPSINAINLIKECEGLKLEAYPDPATNNAPWTIGYGHTQGVVKGMTCTIEQAIQWLEEDSQLAAFHVNRLVKYSLVTQNMFDALCSFVYNLGALDLQNSTLLKKLNSGDVQGAADEFGKWIYGSKKVSQGLVTRRAKEKELFLKWKLK